MGMAVGPIPWTAIATWAAVHGMSDAEEIAVLTHHIREMENAIFKLEQAKAEKK